MRIQAPAIGLDEDASVENVNRALELIELLEEDPFVILSENDLTYMQTLHTNEGFLIDFQAGSIDQHFRFDETFNLSGAQSMFRDYLESRQEWIPPRRYHKISVRGFWHQ